MRMAVVTIVGALALAAAGCGPMAGSPVAARATLELPDDRAARLTRETLARIRPGMTLDEVRTILGSGHAAIAMGEETVSELAWRHAATGREIIVRFRGFTVTGTTSANLP